MTQPGTLTLRDLLGEQYETTKEALDELDDLARRHACLEAVAEAAVRLVASLPRCTNCDEPETHWIPGSNRMCAHHAEGMPERPHAKTLSDLVRALGELKSLGSPKSTETTLQSAAQDPKPPGRELVR